jgi:glutathione S-transferase
MITLYYGPNACALSEHIILEIIWEDYKAINAQAMGADYLKINPKGMVPAMVDWDGPVMTQNHALLNYLTQKYPNAGVSGDGSIEQNYEINNWLAFLGGDLHPAYGAIIHANNLTTATDEDSINAVKMTAMIQVEKQLAYLETWLDGKDYLVGNMFSVADAYAFAVSRWSDVFFGQSLEKFQNIMAYHARVTKIEEVAKVLAIHNPTV